MYLSVAILAGVSWEVPLLSEESWWLRLCPSPTAVRGGLDRGEGLTGGDRCHGGGSTGREGGRGGGRGGG